MMADAATLLNIDEPIIGEQQQPSKQTKGKKRARKPAATGPKSDSSVVVLHDRFVCSHSGEIRSTALFIPGYPGVCFANLPCAFAWINDHVEDPQVAAELKQKTCDEYQQPSIEAVMLPPPRDELAIFGGLKTYQEWIGPLHLWDQMTSQNGLSVAEWQSQRGKKAPGGKERNKVVLEAGSYLIGVGGPAQTKKVTVIGGSIVEIEADDGTTKKRAAPGLTDIKVMQAQDRFIKAHPEYARVMQIGDGFVAIAVVPDALSTNPVAPDPNLHNAYATAIVGLMCYGPCFVINYKKRSVKL